MTRRYMVMLANVYLPSKYKTNGSYFSVKYDGMRALWVPNTRGVNWRSVPFANTIKDNKEGLATGLWSRLGKPIPAPDSFLDQLPESSCLDGELWEGPGLFQHTVGEVKKKDGDWSNVKYMVYDRPSMQQVYSVGDLGWTLITQSATYDDKERRFTDVLLWFGMQKFWNDTIQSATQTLLHHSQATAEQQVMDTLGTILSDGGEGIMLRRGHSTWQPYRSADLVKVKPVDSGEAVIIGYEPGEGKYKGMLGSLILDNNVRISGMLDNHRLLYTNGGMMAFHIGQTVKYNYNGLTRDGSPRHPRLARNSDD